MKSELTIGIVALTAIAFTGCNPFGKSSVEAAGNSSSGSSGSASDGGSGASTALLTISDATTYDFGSVNNGSTGAKTFTITNSGGAAATLSTISTVGLGLAAPYTLTGGTCTTGGTVSSTNGSCTIIVTFSPTSAGVANATVTVNYNNGSIATTATRAITGTGVDTAPSAFAISNAVSTGATTVVLTWAAATGATSYTVKYGTVSGTHSTTFSTTATSPTTITGLTTGTIYYFMVTAVNAIGSTNATAEASATPAPLVSTDLIGYWTFDSSSITGTTASAVAGYPVATADGSLMPALTPPSQVAGHVGGALSFNGTTQYITFGNVMNPTAGITMAAWVKTTAARGQAILSKDGNTTDACSSDGAQSYFLHLNANGTVSCWLNRYDGADSVINGATAVNDGAWHLVVCSAENSASSNNWHIYIDGSLAPDATGTIARNGSNNIIATTTDALVVGAGFRTTSCGFSAQTFAFDGTIDEVRLYQRGISAAESRLLYTTTPLLTPAHTTVTANAQLAFTVTSGISPFTYAVSGGGSITAAGVFTAPSTAGTSTITVTAADGSTASATVSVISAATPSIFNKGMKFNLDAALATGSAAPTSGCTTTTSWTDLFQNLGGTLTGFSGCGATTGWNGAGSAADPYRLTFDGTSDYVSFANSTSFDITTNFTLDAWIYPTSLASRATVFSTMTNASAGSFTFEVGPGNGGTARVSVTTPGVWNADTVDSVVTANAWNHIAYTRASSGTHKIYVNGTSKTLGTNNIVTVATNTNSKILGATTTSAQFFPGSIANFKIYDAALSSTAIARNCNALSSRFSGANCATYSAPTKLVLSGPATLILNACEAITVYAKDASDNLSEVNAATTINISESGSTTLYDNALCTTPATSISMAADTSSATFYIKGTVDGVTKHLSAADNASNLTTATTLSLVVEENPIPGISGLLAWYRADTINQANGTTVTSWADSSGNNNNATQATSNAQPTFATGVAGVMNTMPAVRFADADGAEDYLTLSTAITTIRTAILVVQHSDGNQDYPFILGDNGGSALHGGGATGLFYYVFGYIFSNNNGVATAPAAFTKSTTPQLIAITFNADVASTSYISRGNVAGRFWDGWISEIVLYNNSAIDSNGVKSIERFLALKYGISLPLNY